MSGGSGTYELKITAKDGGFEVGLRQLEQKAAASSKRMGKEMGRSISSGIMDGYDRAKAGLEKGMSALKAGLGSVGQFGGLGAAIGVSALVDGAMKAQSSMLSLSHATKVGNGEFLSYARIASATSNVTKRWGQDTEKLTAAMNTVFEGTGDSKLAADTIEKIGMASRATGKEVGLWADLAGSANEQFGVTSDQMGDALASIYQASNQGGASLEDFAGNFARLGRASKLAGIDGVDGMKQVLALTNQLEDATGSGTAAIDVLAGALSKLEANKSTRKALAAQGIDTKGSAIDILGNILKKTGGDPTKLGQFFKANEAVAISQGLGGGRFEEALAKAGEKSMSEAELRTMAAEQMETGAAKFEQAIAIIKDKMASPEVVSGITKLADLLPKLADVLAKVIGAVSDNPYTAGALLGASRMGDMAGALGANRALEGTAGAADKASAGLGGLGKAVGAAELALIAWGIAADQYQKYEAEAGQAKVDEADQVNNLLNMQDPRDGLPTYTRNTALGEEKFKVIPTSRTDAGQWNYKLVPEDEMAKATEADYLATHTAGKAGEGGESGGSANAATEVEGSPIMQEARAGLALLSKPRESIGIPDALRRPGLGAGETPEMLARPDRVQGGGGMNGDQAALLREMLTAQNGLPRALAGTTLTVRVENIADLQASAPGHAPRVK